MELKNNMKIQIRLLCRVAGPLPSSKCFDISLADLHSRVPNHACLPTMVNSQGMPSSKSSNQALCRTLRRGSASKLQTASVDVRKICPKRKDVNCNLTTSSLQLHLTKSPICVSWHLPSRSTSFLADDI